jgi:cardiolipin synthase
MNTSDALTLTFPWRRLDPVTILVGGDSFYPDMLVGIAQAKHEILLETYMIDSGQVLEKFIGALSAAATRGVSVKMMVDAIGATRFNTRDRERLLESGVALRFYNPLTARQDALFLARNHRKMLVVDGERVWTGGPGIADVFDPDSHPRAWHDLAISTSGDVVTDWRALFFQVWEHQQGMPPVPLGSRVKHVVGNIGAKPRGGRGITRLNTSRGWGQDPLKAELLRRCRAADGQIWLATAYFMPTLKFRRSLIHASRRGVDVQLLLPGPDTDHPPVRHAGRRYYGALLRAGVRIYEYQHRFSHMKAAVVDDWVSLGSCNFDRWNLRWNLEANQEILDSGVVQRLREVLANDFAQAVEITPDLWRSRPWTEKLSQHVWSRLMAVAELLTLRWRNWRTASRRAP